MTNKEKLDKIKAHIKKNYEPEDGAATSLHSEGNYDDVFSDGFDRGMCIALWELVEILGLDFPEPHEQNFDNW